MDRMNPVSQVVDLFWVLAEYLRNSFKSCRSHGVWVPVGEVGNKNDFWKRRFLVECLDERRQTLALLVEWQCQVDDGPGDKEGKPG